MYGRAEVTCDAVVAEADLKHQDETSRDSIGDVRSLQYDHLHR